LKSFSDVFPRCLPEGNADPIIKSLRVKREKNHITVELEGLAPSPGWAAEAARLIGGALGMSASVVFQSPAAPRQPIFGKPEKLKATSIDVLPREKAKACVSGRVFALGETRERKAKLQNRWQQAIVYEFYLTDNTGSVCVRYAAGRDNPPKGLEARLKDLCKSREYITVYGTMDMYSYSDEEEWYISAVCAAETETPRRADNAGQKRVELHLHTTMSDKDAVSSASDLIACAARWGHPAVAVTDHGVCHAFPEAMAAGEKHGVKVIYGVEGYLAPQGGKDRAHHIILLAQTQTGLRNLYKLISLAHLENFYRRPRFSKDMLTKYREGLIIGAACESGEVFAAVRSGEPWETVKQTASFYDYLEIQPICNNRFLIGEGAAQDEETLRDWNRAVVRLGKELSKPVCATCDVHFQDPGDEIYRSVLLSGMGMSSSGPLPLYFRTTCEMLEEFAYLGEETAYETVVTNPLLIAGMIESIRPLPKGEFVPRIEGSAGELRETAYSRAHELYGDPLPKLIETRLEKEISSIIGKGYEAIYTVSRKLVQRSMENGYLVGSRGSVGSSIAAYFAGITEVNALPPHYRCPACKHSEFTSLADCGADLPDNACPDCGTDLEKDGFDIPFATFMGFDADKTPDIDLNFSGEYQDRAMAHTVELFGADNVFRAGTITTIKEKNAMGYTLKYLESRNEHASNAELKLLAKGCEGVRTTTGQHAGGMVIVPQGYEIYDFCPIHRAANKKDGTVCTHFDYKAIEANLLKLDILGHDCPTFIRHFEEHSGESGQTIPLCDPSAMSIFSSTAALGFENDDLIGPVGTVGIPEYGTRNVRGMLKKTKPSTFDELVRISVLSHGEGVWQGNAEKLIDEGTATLREVICARDDIMLYLISKGLPDIQSFSISERVRRGGGLTPEWEADMRAAGVPGWYIWSCNTIKYMFPKAHAVAYAMMSARIAWIKTHRPEIFYSVYFTLKIGDFNYDVCGRDAASIARAIKRTEQDKEASKTDKDKATVMEAVYEMLLRGIVFEPLDVHASDAMRFSPAGKGRVSVPLMAVAGLGDAAANSIVKQRKKSPFLAEDDLLSRCGKVTKAHVESLRAAGALGGMPETAQIALY
jgi:DNA polymerase-3 subunit alpha (Gram-positive type)